jgi:hypothetical protein
MSRITLTLSTENGWLLHRWFPIIACSSEVTNTCFASRERSAEPRSARTMLKVSRSAWPPLPKPPGACRKLETPSLSA